MAVNDTNFVWNLRREVLQGLVDAGYKVTLVTQVLDFKEDIEKLGCKIINVNNSRRGTNPFSDLQLMKKYIEIFKAEKPDVVLTNNIKPNVYAGMACQKLKIPYMPNICGLGTPVENPGLMQKLTIFLYRKGVKGASAIFFQNSANRQFFYDHNMMPKNANVVLTPGSGVNLQAHPALDWPDGDEIHFLYVARVMKQKGIDLFLAAARKYADEKVIFDVCGQCDDENYKKILAEEKSVRYHGLQKNITPFYKECSCFLYPSYYPEGMSNVLLEAAASARPVIAADRAGCRETLEDGVTGFLVPVNDEEAVINAVGRFLSMTKEEKMEMGRRGCEKIRREFDRRIVVEMFLEDIRKVLGE